MKIIITILSLINGLYMLIDGIHVIIKSKYLGPEKPGPWANTFHKMNIDVFNLGPLFIIYGIAWLTFLYGIWTGQSWAYFFGIIISILTLWYLPIGTFISIIILILLLINKNNIPL